jgi:hypothetical protein
MKTFFFISFAAISIAAPALSRHVEPHDWIVNNPRYVTAAGPHCCGPEHCAPVEPGEIVPAPGGWRHVPTDTVLTRKTKGIYPSEDPHLRTWRCVWGGAMQCVFPGGGG